MPELHCQCYGLGSYINDFHVFSNCPFTEDVKFMKRILKATHFCIFMGALHLYSEYVSRLPSSYGTLLMSSRLHHK